MAQRWVAPTRLRQGGDAKKHERRSTAACQAGVYSKLTHRRVFRYARNMFGAIKGYEGVFGNVNPALWATSMRHRRRIDRALPNTVVDPGGRPLYH